MCRSDAPASTAVLRSSLIFIEAGGLRPPASSLSASGRYGFGPLAQGRFLWVHVREPPVAVGDFAVNHLEERGLQRLGYRSGLSRTNFDLVDRPHRRHFGRRA